MMSDYEKIYDFQNLYKAHRVARLGKRGTGEVIDFELNLAQNLKELSTALKNHTYTMSGYYSFLVHDPKKRIIHALHYRDRVVQHCLCDEVLAPILERKLIYDNAACRKEKGTHFSLERLTGFLRKTCQLNGSDGYFLKCDIKKFFDHIDHEILKYKLGKVIKDKEVLRLLDQIVDSYEKTPGKGIPLGNQTSQWFAIYYLDEFDRLVKEKLRIKFYTRYMDDCVLVHESKEYLQSCLESMKTLIKENLKLEFNQKTQIAPMKNGIDYLGFHFYITDTGKVIKKVKQQTKYKYKRKLKYLQEAYAAGEISLSDVKQVLSSYHAHFSHGNAYRMESRALNGAAFCRKDNRIMEHPEYDVDEGYASLI